MTMVVFSRLPAKSLYRFRSVSKSWNSLLCTNFIRSRDKTNCKKLYIFHPKFRFSLDYYEADFDAAPNSGLTLTKRKKYPFKDSAALLGDAGLFTSCDSWLLLGDRETNKLWFFNPSTKEYEEFQGFPHDDFYDVSYGICCDRSQNEYKIVGVLVRDVSGPQFFNVFSLETKSWAESRSFPFENGYCHNTCKHGLSVNGTPHWIHKYSRSVRKIISFDVKDEKFVEFPPPKPRFDDISFYFHLGSIGENLAAYALASYRLKVWVMKEYGVKESWIKVFDILESVRICTVQPLIFTKKGELMLLSWSEEKLLINNHREDKYKTQSNSKSQSVL